MMIEDTLGYREMMRMTQILRLIEPDIIPVTKIDQDPFLRRSIFLLFLCFAFAYDSAFLR